MPKYRKKPVVVEAVQFTGENLQEIAEFVSGSVEQTRFYDIKLGALTIHTLEGDMRANPGDYIIKGIKGEYYPCKPDIFEQTYEPVEEKKGGGYYVPPFD